MKGEYVEDKDRQNMFAKLQQQPNHPHHTPATAAARKETNGDEATIEVVRRPRGRPPGSKNKPKPPVIITRDAEPSMSPYVLEVSGGADIVDAVTQFCRRRNMGICIINASGMVVNVSLRQPTAPPGTVVTFHGRFEILSLSATILSQAALSAASGFAVTLAGPQGQVMGGAVVGPLVAAGTVYVVAASFGSPSFHRLPAEEDVGNSCSGGGGNEMQSPPAVSSGGDGSRAAAEACGVSLYSGHLPSDVIWAPTARQPPPHYL